MALFDALAPYVPHILLGCAAVSLLLYVVLDGFDLGVGVLSLFEPDGTRREEMMESIATVWDGNESWLVMLGAVLFAGFPLVFGVVLPALYIPLFLMLFFLTFRGIAFEFQAQHSEHSRLWGYSFALGSLGTAFFQGVSLGAFMDGLSFSGDAFTGGAFDFVSPLSLATGLLVTAVYVLSGAGWLVYKSGGELLASARRWGRRAVPVALVLALVTVALSSVYSPAAGNVTGLTVQSFLAFGLFGAAGVSMVAAYFALGGRDDLKSLGFAALAMAGLVGGFMAMIYPNVILPGVTMQEAVAPNSSAGLLLVVIVPLIPVTMAYNAVAYYLFRGKTEVGHHKKPGGESTGTSTQEG
ncbi:cytochrome d ubiquinol oxidase subunit II [Rubrobacter indicoceani]|uniref:cytochrome d ubiquinol oxidase subunit II n=1 Tax=Rubrobacter indicoceani TaxID=2051957 RepID=UPI000E5AA0A9|nr:cytochrome d ubiquinol oxidase subunit II [Rubrobacter indicoceani]